jgi:hypothetical protein
MTTVHAIASVLLTHWWAAPPVLVAGGFAAHFTGRALDRRSWARSPASRHPGAAYDEAMAIVREGRHREHP